MDRRRFLETLFAAGIGAHQLDIEKLLWTPTKTIFIPPPVRLIRITRRGFCMVRGLALPLPWRKINEGWLPAPSLCILEESLDAGHSWRQLGEYES